MPGAKPRATPRILVAAFAGGFRQEEAGVARGSVQRQAVADGAVLGAQRVGSAQPQAVQCVVHVAAEHLDAFPRLCDCRFPSRLPPRADSGATSCRGVRCVILPLPQHDGLRVQHVRARCARGAQLSHDGRLHGASPPLCDGERHARDVRQPYGDALLLASTSNSPPVTHDSTIPTKPESAVGQICDPRAFWWSRLSREENAAQAQVDRSAGVSCVCGGGGCI